LRGSRKTAPPVPGPARPSSSLAWRQEWSPKLVALRSQPQNTPLISRLSRTGALHKNSHAFDSTDNPRAPARCAPASSVRYLTPFYGSSFVGIDAAEVGGCAHCSEAAMTALLPRIPLPRTPVNRVF
jgi:hypothetical protein